MTKPLTQSMALPGECLLVVAGANVIAGSGPVPVSLRSAGRFAILTKTGITDVPSSAINGDVGTSPITGAALLLTCAEVRGNLYRRRGRSHPLRGD